MEDPTHMLEIINLDKLFDDTPNAKILPITDLTTAGKVREFVSQIFSATKRLGFAASCDNGCTQANFYLGMICPKCKTVVRENFASELWYSTWIEIPPFSPPVLHPAVHRVVSEVLGSVRTENSRETRGLLDILMDNQADLPEELEDKVPQGMGVFHDNFWSIMDTLIKEYPPLMRKQRHQILDDLMKFLHKFKDRLFVRKLPILDPSLHLLTKHGGVTLTDVSSPLIISSITALSGLIHTYHTRSERVEVMDQQLCKFYTTWIQYPESILEDKLAHKKGMFRKGILGTRTHCSFRGVIVPIVEEHVGDELHVPWRVGTSILKLEILNVLINRQQMSFQAAMSKYFTAETSYDPDIHAIIKQLIKECPYKGLPVLFGRNPSIQLGCEQLLFITKVNSDLHNSAIGISPRIVNAPNAKRFDKHLLKCA
jgi:hypothetical protein